MLASACGCGGPRVQVRPVLTSETAATTVPLREATYEAAAVPSGSCAWEEDGDGEAGRIVPAASGPPPGVRTAGSRPVAEGPAAAGPVREELCGAGAWRITSLDRRQQHTRRGTAGPQHAQGLHAPGGRRLHLPASRRGPARPRHVPVQAARGAHQNLIGRVATGAADYAGRIGQFLDVELRFALP